MSQGANMVALGNQNRAAVLRFVRDYISREGWAPSLDEIESATGVSKSSVWTHLRLLADAGEIRLGSGPRKIALVGVSDCRSNGCSVLSGAQLHDAARTACDESGLLTTPIRTTGREG